MTSEFQYDVFLSHSSKDKAIVRDLADRLTKDGLKVWFDKSVLKAGDNIPSKIEEGLEHSRVLVLCMSANAFGSDWAQLESGTFRFRDPLNKDRRFIPLRMDDAPIKGSLGQFLYVNWQATEREQEYPKLLEACSDKAEKKPQTNNVEENPGNLWNLGEMVRIVTFSTLVHRAGDEFHYEILVQAKNRSERVFGKSGISLSIPTIDTRKLYWKTYFNTNAKAPWGHPIYGPKDMLFRRQQHQMVRAPARHVLIETSESYWKPRTEIGLKAEFTAPNSQMVFSVRAWANCHRTDWTTDLVADPVIGSGEPRDQQNFEAFWRSVGLKHKKTRKI